MSSFDYEQARRNIDEAFEAAKAASDRKYDARIKHINRVYAFQMTCIVLAWVLLMVSIWVWPRWA